MRIGLACVELKGFDLSYNLDQAVKTIAVGAKHKIQLLLFGQQFLGQQPITIDSQALFRLKIACTYYDLAIGIGFLQEQEHQISDNYIVINQSGEIIYNHWIEPSFKLSEKEFRIVLGDEGFESTHSNEKLIWPILSRATPTDWVNTELLRYRTQAHHLAHESILVNSFEENQSYGGGFHLRDNQLIVNQPMEQKGISIIEL